jgi:hypothetical protein
MRPLNEWVIRSENLKKYNVLGQIGEGAQAKVYKIQRKMRLPLPNEPRHEQQTPPTIFAIKVINKDKLLKRS